jgi:hypothetical protein
MNKKDCKGCPTLYKNERCMWFDDELDCPCASCIVKAMCTVSCELLDNHIHLIRGPRMVKDKS